MRQKSVAPGNERKKHLLVPIVLAMSASLFSSETFARSRGIAGVGCEGCHGGHENSSASLSPLVVTPGQTATLQFTISDPDAKVVGLFIEIDDTTGFTVASGSRLAVLESGITHTSPTEVSGGKVTHEVSWLVPSMPGAKRFVVSSVAGNGDSRNGGDEGLVEYFDVVWGCSPQTYYRDFDGDGFGQESLPLVHCTGTPPSGYATQPGDCDDNYDTVYPGAEEFCNRKDDDCDGEIDEDALPVELYPDADRDGYYSTAERLSGEVVMGCVPYPGYADLGGDCAPDDPLVNPGAEEVCDLYTDENCNGRVDERVRPICGEGWCRRESYTCDIEDCIPGTPVEETCNFMDDDCDGEVDEGDLCPPGEECLAGQCRPAEIATNPGAGSPLPGSDAGAGDAASRKSRSSTCAAVPPASRLGSWIPLVFGLSAYLAVARRRRRGNQK